MVRGIDMNKPLFFVTPNAPKGRACIWKDKAQRTRNAQIKALIPLARNGNVEAMQALRLVLWTNVVAGAV